MTTGRVPYSVGRDPVTRHGAVPSHGLRWGERMSASDNLHPADELAKVRNKIRELKEREDELRVLLIDLPAKERAGVVYRATVVHHTHKRLDKDMLEKEMGPIADRLYRTIEITMIKIKR